MDDVTLGGLEAIGGAVAHRARLRILALLREGDVFVCQVRRVLTLAPSTVSVHMAVLRRAGLIAERREGRFVRYSLTAEEPLGSVVRELLYLVKDDPQVTEDARRLEALRRIAIESVCRGGRNLAAAETAGRARGRRRRARARERRVAPATGSR